MSFLSMLDSLLEVNNNSFLCGLLCTCRADLSSCICVNHYALTDGAARQRFHALYLRKTLPYMNNRRISVDDAAHESALRRVTICVLYAYIRHRLQKICERGAKIPLRTRWPRRRRRILCGCMRMSAPSERRAGGARRRFAASPDNAG